MREVHEAVILAAGRGSRLDSSDAASAKCLATVGGAKLIEHQIAAVRRRGIERVIVVVGHEAHAVRASAGDGCVFIENPVYAQTNSLYSLWLTREVVRGPFILMNCDVLADPRVLDRLLDETGTALAFDSRSGDEPEHMKVEIVDGTLRAISKELPASQTCGENVGILRFDAADTPELFRLADEFIQTGKSEMWAPAVVGKLAESRPVRCVDVADLNWVEIDFPEDLEHARRVVWPRIQPLVDAGRTTNGSTANGSSRNDRDTSGAARAG